MRSELLYVVQALSEKMQRNVTDLKLQLYRNFIRTGHSNYYLYQYHNHNYLLSLEFCRNWKKWKVVKLLFQLL